MHMIEICLGNRTAETVKIYFEKARQPEIRAVLPQKAQTVEEALEDYRGTLLPNASSYGRIIVANGKYIGDIWCYCIDRDEQPNAMLSYCIFEEELWSRGIATRAVALFLHEIREKFGCKTVGAFTYSDNVASVRVLEKNGFSVAEEFAEDGRLSKYLQKSI